MKYAEAATLANDLRKLADFIETNGVKLPSYGSHTFTMRYYLTKSDYVDSGEVDEDGNKVWNTVVDEAVTKANVRGFVRALGSCDKKYEGDRLNVIKRFGGEDSVVKIVGTSDRSVTCRKVVTGYKTEPAVNLPERQVEIVEWECDEAPSLLALTQD
jgi:hypothetical protein